VLIWALGGVAALLVVLYAIGWFLTGDRVPNGVTVAGVDIGGMTAEEAEETLATELAGPASAAVIVAHKKESFEITPEDAGLGLDVEATVSEAGGGQTWNPITMVDVLLGGGSEVAPVPTVDEAALQSAVEAVATSLDAEPREPFVTFNRKGDPDVTAPRDGVQVDVAATGDDVVAAYIVSDQPVPVVADETPPAVDKAALDEAMTAQVEPAVADDVNLKLPGQNVPLRVRDYAEALTFEVQDGALVPVLDVKQLTPSIERISDRIGADAEDATVELQNGSPVVVPAKPGVELDPQDVADAVVPVLAETGSARTAAVGKSVSRPDFTTKDAKQLKIKRVVSDFVTYYPHAEYRNINQGRAAELINGTLLKPGETFSFNDTVGERTAANGFTTGYVISNGVLVEDLGGGVSQGVTTMYKAAFFAGMEDVEHKPHSFYIDRYPMGREATVAWPSLDLRFKNTTPYGVLIEAWVVPSSGASQGEMHVRMWSKKYWNVEAGLSERYAFTSPGTRYDPTDRCVANTGYGGFSVDVTRTMRRVGSDEVADRQVWKVVYTPADTVICSAPPKT